MGILKFNLVKTIYWKVPLKIIGQLESTCYDNKISEGIMTSALWFISEAAHTVIISFWELPCNERNLFGFYRTRKLIITCG